MDNNSNWRYTLLNTILITFMAVSLFMVYGALSVFIDDDVLGLLAGILIGVPLGFLSFGIFLFVWWREKNKSLSRKRFLLAGMIIGIIAALLSPVLFLLVKP